MLQEKIPHSPIKSLPQELVCYLQNLLIDSTQNKLDVNPLLPEFSEIIKITWAVENAKIDLLKQLLALDKS
jgi:hypothetical protein